MRIWTHITIPTLRESTAHLRLKSVATFLAPVLVGVVDLIFFVAPAVAQGSRPDTPGAPASDVSNIPKPLTDTFERVQMRNAPYDAQAGQKTAEKENTCLLPPLTLVRSPIVAATALQVPPKARKEYQEACSALNKKKTADAEKHLRKAVHEYPKYSVAWVTMGQVLAAQHRIDDARSACSQGSTANPMYVPAQLCLADIAAQAHDWSEVLKLSSHALELDPSNNAVAYEYHAAANLNLHKLREAEKSGLRAVEIDKEHREPRTYFVLAQIYEAKGDFANEAEQLREYLKYAANPDDIAAVKQYLSRLEKQTAAVGAVDVLSASSSTGLASSLTRHRGPADVDDAILPVLNDATCPLPQILKETSNRTQDLIDNLQRFSAKERIEQIDIDKNGRRRNSTEVVNYVVQIEQNSSGYPRVVEYRSGNTGTRKASLTDSGTAAFALIFHPTHVGHFDFRCEGLTELRGSPAWQVHFEGSADPNKAFTAIRLGGLVYLPRFKGRAWVATNSYDVMRIETDLVAPIPEIDLQLEHMVISYAPVEFQERQTRLWLPESVSLSIAYQGHRYERVHNFGQFLLFSVNTTQATKEPTARKDVPLQ
jgi:tetratricopeptide (TPR) repeat protein